MYLTVAALAVFSLPSDVVDAREDPTQQNEQFTKLTIDDMTIQGRSVRLDSNGVERTCTVAGNATLSFGDITVTADQIRMQGVPEFKHLVCHGNCRWQQDDGNAEFFAGDSIEILSDGIRINGNARLRFGTDGQTTVVTCDKIVVRHGVKGYQLMGDVRLHRDE